MKLHPWLLRMLLISSVCLVTARSRADALRAALGGSLREVSHAVDISIADGVASYRIRRVFANAGQVADEAGLAIDLPFGAAATGLRIRARDTWYKGELMEAGHAAALYQELTGIGAFAPKDPALLQWLWSDKLYLQVFPVLPGATSTVEYTLTVPTRYREGRVMLSYPRGPARDANTDDDDVTEASLPLATPVITVRPGWGDATARVLLDGERVPPDTPLVLEPKGGTAWAPDGEQDGRASYVASVIEVQPSTRTATRFDKVWVEVHIAHTYRSDLAVELLTPTGERALLSDGTEGTSGENGLHLKREVKLSAETAGHGTWRLIVSDHAALDAGSLEAWTLVLGERRDALKFSSVDTPIFIPDAPERAGERGVATIAVDAPRFTGVLVRRGQVVVASDLAFDRLELDVAQVLAPIPKRAQVVFVLDASHSQGPDGIEAQAAAIRAYLAHVPDAEVEIVVYRRVAEALFGGFIAAEAVPARLASALAQGALAPANGSNLDLGLKRAALALQGRRGPQRMVVLSDSLLRPSFSVERGLAWLATLPSRAVVHVVNPAFATSYEVQLQRDDSHALAPLSSHHHGIYVKLEGPASIDDEALRRGILGLVRPTQIDFVEAVRVPKAIGQEMPQVLREGESVRLMQQTSDGSSGSWLLRGKMWSDPWRREIRPSRAFSRASAAWVFSEDLHGSLDEQQMMKVAQMGRAVSPVTSYLAIEPGVRPSPIGLPEEPGSISLGDGGSSGTGYGRGSETPRVPPDLMALVPEQAATCRAKHPPPPGTSLVIDVDTTLDEIVDVVPANHPRALAPLAACLVEMLWSVRLDARFDLPHERFALQFNSRAHGANSLK